MRRVLSAVVTSVVQRHYWLGTRTSGHVDANATAVPNYGARAAYFEPAVSNRNIGVKIRNLTKVLITMHHIGALKIPGMVHDKTRCSAIADGPRCRGR